MLITQQRPPCVSVIEDGILAVCALQMESSRGRGLSLAVLTNESTAVLWARSRNEQQPADHSGARQAASPDRLSELQVSAPAEPEQLASPSSNDQGAASRLDTGPIESSLRQVLLPLFPD